MSITPSGQIDPQLVQRLSDEFVALGRQLGQVGADLGVLRAQLYSAPRQMPAGPPVPPVQAVQPVPPVAPVPPVQPQWTSAPAWGPPRRPVPPAVPFRSSVPPARAPWWQRDGVISRVLAFAGAGVTLLGVVMLLVLAAQAGFFGPIPRVVAGAVFSVALVGAALAVYERPGGKVGGIALAATGVAGAYLDVVAVVALYGWIVPPLGLLAALGVCAFGIALAARWDSQALALLVVSGVAVLAPVVTSGMSLTLVAFLVVVQIACFPVQLVRDWPYLHVARTVPAVLATLAAIADATVRDTGTVSWVLASAVVVAVIGFATAIASVRRTAGDVVSSVLLAVSAIPLLGAVVLLDRPASIAVPAALAAVALTIAALRILPGHTRIAALATGSVALLQMCVETTTVDTFPLAALVVAAAFLGAAGRERSKVAYATGAVFAALGGLAFYATAPLAALVAADRAVRDLGEPVIAGGGLLIGVVALHAWQGARLAVRTDGDRTPFLVVAGMVGLYALTAGSVAAGVSIAGTDGFTAGHCAATIAWMITATAVLLYGLRGSEKARVALGGGLFLTGAALAKLFLFDLATLDGVVRVLAFVVVGLLLLALGTKYARVFAERDDAPSSASLASTTR